MTHDPGVGAARAPRAKLMPPHFLELKRKGVPIAVVTAYDFPTARRADEAGVDALPAAKQAMYNWQRRSKILFKPL